jgi:two-component system phosphate regulon sensor histidine kinase PhoR
MLREGVQSMLAAVPLPMMLIGNDLRIGALNDPGLKLFGPASLDRHYNLTLRQPQLVEAIEAVSAGGSKRSLRVTLSQGIHETAFDISVAPVPGMGMLCCFVDVTELELVGQQRRDFVANVSHELRTPLTALLGFIETLQGPAKHDPVARERFLGIMEREAGRMARLVRDLLSLSRVESEERRRPSGRVDLGGLVRMTIATLKPVATDAAVTVELIGADAPTPVPGDSDQLTQVFHNLIENAIKYGGSGKQVTVTIRALDDAPGLRGRSVEVSVQDRGDGIEAVHLPRLTERFYRVDTHRSREKGGTGLGLAIVKHIINRHRGRLRIESEIGRGSIFSVILPVE